MVAVLLYFALAMGGLVMTWTGVSALLAARQLEGRVARLIAPSARPEAKFFRMTGMLTARGRDRAEIEEKLRQAGFQDDQAMERFLWLRLGSTLAAVLLVAVGSRLVSGGFFTHPLIMIMAGGGTYLASKRTLLLFAASRQRAITREFPFLLDMMLMMLESGVSLDQCFRTIAGEETNAAPLLTRSVQALVIDLDRGMSYEGALDRWSNRLRVSGVQELASLFQQSLFQGIELSPALREFNREFTDRRVGAAREAMGKIGVQMVIVMMLFFMPALFIVIGAPPLVGLLDTLGGVGK
ncbi:MAG: pilus assembly protein TadC [Rhizorhabdus sp.]|nr:pilus assembly protein TadC [Rhizorhabdus sp.]